MTNKGPTGSDLAETTKLLEEVFGLMEKVPVEEELVISLRLVILEKLPDLLGRVLEFTGKSIEFDAGGGFILTEHGWRAAHRTPYVPFGTMSRSLSYDVLVTTLRYSLNELVKILRSREDSAEVEAEKLVKLLSCLNELDVSNN